MLMEHDDPEKRIADLERQLVEQRSMARREHPQGEAVPRPGLSAEDVGNVAFAQAAYGERSYNCDEVDAFLDRVEAVLKEQTGRTLTPEQVRNTFFSKPRAGSRGYAEADVDAFLEQLEIELDRRTGQRSLIQVGAGGSAAEPGGETRTGSRLWRGIKLLGGHTLDRYGLPGCGGPPHGRQSGPEVGGPDAPRPSRISHGEAQRRLTGLMADARGRASKLNCALAQV